MRSITRLAIGAAVVLSVAAAVQPAQAACAPPGFTFNSLGAYLVSNPDWCGGDGSGCQDAAAVSPNLSGFFWGQTNGNAARLAGTDNGAWPVHEWTKSVGIPYAGGTYWYPAFLTVNDYPTNPAGVAGYPLNWGSTNIIDGCPSTDITPTIFADECSCILLTDQWNGDGYFAILSSKADALGNFPIFQDAGTTVQFAPIPRAEVTESGRIAATGQVSFTVNVPPPQGGDYRNPQCDCGFGFRVYAQVVGEGGMVPADRRACTQESLFAATGQSIAPNSPTFIQACKTAGFGWVPAVDPAGNPQGFTPFGATRTTSDVLVNCGDPAMGYDVYLSTSLGTNEGPGAVQLSNVSNNSFQVKCGNYQLAEPNRPRSPEALGQSGTPRGRERGGRER
jgi:hypothetical protein